MSRPLRLLAAILAALSFAWLVVVLRWSLWPLDPQLNNAVGLTSGQDFASFHAAGALARAGRAADAYDFALLRAAMAGVIGERASVFFMPWAYPPTFQLVLAPLAALRPDRALLVWATLMAIAIAVAGWLIGRRWWIAAVALIHPAFALALVYGQNGPLTALLLAAGYVAAERAPTRAGVAWGLLGFKPHLAFAALALAAVRGRWRTFAAAAATAAAVALLAVLALGIEPWLAFLEA